MHFAKGFVTTALDWAVSVNAADRVLIARLGAG